MNRPSLICFCGLPSYLQARPDCVICGGTSASLVAMSEERLARLAGERQELLPRPVLLPGALHSPSHGLGWHHISHCLTEDLWFLCLMAALLSVGSDLAVQTGERQLNASTSQEKRLMNQRKRIVRKGGLTNVIYKNISKKRRRYFSDLYTTLLDSPWRYCVLMFAASFYFSWLLFAVLYYLVSQLHGDLQPAGRAPGRLPCIQVRHLQHSHLPLPLQELDGFAAAFLFSLETQHTIGYGSRQITTQCPEAQLLVSIQVATPALSPSSGPSACCRPCSGVSSRPSWWAWSSPSWPGRSSAPRPSSSANGRSSPCGTADSASSSGSGTSGMTTSYLVQRSERRSVW